MGYVEDNDDLKSGSDKGYDNKLAGPSQLPVPQDNPPAYTQHPPSGFRLPLTTDQPIPQPDSTGRPCAFDADGRSPIFFGSALLATSVHPCKIAPALTTPCRVAYGGKEFEHHGRYDLLPFNSSTMELVPTSHGRIPPGRRPIDGGYEENGEKLYHALARIDGILVPGKTGTHLVREIFAF